jgi:hypothetical protein
MLDHLETARRNKESELVKVRRWTIIKARQCAANRWVKVESIWDLDFSDCAERYSIKIKFTKRIERMRSKSYMTHICNLLTMDN